jgi:hypothetical protein
MFIKITRRVRHFILLHIDDKYTNRGCFSATAAISFEISNPTESDAVHSVYAVRIYVEIIYDERI